MKKNLPIIVNEGNSEVGRKQLVIPEEKFLKILYQHFDSEIPLERLALSKPQIERFKVVREAYSVWCNTPGMTVRKIRNYLSNYHNRSYKQIRLDLAAIKFLAEKMEIEKKKFKRIQADARLEEAYEIASQKGDAQMIIKVVDMMNKLHDLSNPADDPDDLETSMAGAAEHIWIDDFSRIDPNKKHYTKEEMKQIYKKLGGTDDKYFDREETLLDSEDDNFYYEGEIVDEQKESDSEDDEE